MCTSNEQKGNGNPTETSQQLEDVKEKNYGVPQNFDVLTSGFDRFIFKYAWRFF
jgi:hypothetical protein